MSASGTTASGTETKTAPDVTPRHLYALLDRLPELVLVLAPDGTCRWCNLAFARLTGQPRAQLLGKDCPLPRLRAIGATGAQPPLECWLEIPDTGPRLIRFEITTGAGDDGAGDLVLITGRDMTPLHRLQQPLAPLQEDNLPPATDIQVRARLEHALQRAQRAQEYVAFVSLQLSELRPPPAAGEGADGRKGISQLLQRQIRGGDTLARLHSGAWLLVLEQIDCPAAIERVIDKLVAALEQVREADRPRRCLNIGVVVSPDDGDTVAELIDRSEQALHRSIMLEERVYYF
jgi:GGDEF domain-containing protein